MKSQPDAIALPWKHFFSAAVMLAVLSMALPVSAQGGAMPPPRVLQDPSLDELREALFVPTTVVRGFQRTAPPTTDGLCPGAGAVAASRSSGTDARTFVPVPLAGNEAPRANLAVQFATGSDALSPRDRQMLDRLAQVLQEPGASEARFAVAGHTDATGSDAINLELSCARAIAVRRYLVDGKGIAPERISAYGFGSRQLLEVSTGPSSINRRVEVRRAD